MVVVSLPLLLITQAEIVAEHRLEQFAFAKLKITHARRADQPEGRPNFFTSGRSRQMDKASIFTTTSRKGS
jgi:hypothetical protein